MSNSLASWFNFRIRRLSPAEADVGPVLLEFQSPTAALLAMPVQPAARSMLGVVLTLVIASGLILATCPVDVVVTGGGRMVSTSPTIVLQPLETSIVRCCLSRRVGRGTRWANAYVWSNSIYLTNLLLSDVKRARSRLYRSRY